jgi:hypothetical protein
LSFSPFSCASPISRLPSFALGPRRVRSPRVRLGRWRRRGHLAPPSFLPLFALVRPRSPSFAPHLPRSLATKRVASLAASSSVFSFFILSQVCLFFSFFLCSC